MVIHSPVVHSKTPETVFFDTVSGVFLFCAFFIEANQRRTLTNISFYDMININIFPRNMQRSTGKENFYER